ncbi:Pet127-domain-containing protein [Hypoxylon sp. FL1150]|nr:Pet127-domain-containing protein [Hypoxylon sp. FL1150]
MLRLGSRSVHRIGTSYVCASCLAASHPSRSHALRPTSIPSYHSRSITSTSVRPAPSTQTSPPAEDGSQSASDPVQEDHKRKKKSKVKKTSKKPQTPAEPILSKKAASRNEGERQLQVLQGALQALKNVLASQNINVEEIGNPTKQTKQAKSESKAKAKDKAKVKSKPDTKPSKAKDETTSESQDTSGKGDGKSTEQKHADKVHATTVDAAPTLSTPKDKPASPKSKAGRSRKRARSPRMAASAKTPAEDSPKLATPKKPAKDVRRSKISALRESLRNLSLNEGKDSIDRSPVTGHEPDEVRGPYQMIGQPFMDRPKKTSQVIGNPFSGESRPTKKKAKGKESMEKLSINSISSHGLQAVPIDTERIPVPSLSYGLERVLFNPGVYCLQDPRSKVYNFDPYLSEIMPIQEFDFNALKQYVTSSKDTTLIGIAKEHKKKYTGSTSSMTSMLSHFHYLLSSWREINTSMLSRQFVPDSVQFTRLMRGPAAVFLHWKDGAYAIDADKEFDTANILSMLGKSMEKLLTLSTEEFERYRHVNSGQITEEERNAAEAFHYTSFGDFMMRSQLDAYDPRIPGTGMFDLKTRAVVTIRMDAKGFQKGLGYEIRKRFGQWESFEREYYDMIRSAFLKYSLQVRMGRMDGIFVAFHNTQRIFGFQYIPLEEMDLALHGTNKRCLGNKEYLLSLSLLNDILDRATKRFPEKSLRIHFETRTSVGAPFMYIFAKPVTQEDIDTVQNAGKKSIEAFEKEILGMAKEEEDADSDPTMENDDVGDEDEDTEESSVTQEMSSLEAWKEVRHMVEDAVDDDELGLGAVREAIEDSLEQSGLLHARSSTEARGYVDALLSALTSDNPSGPIEPSLETLTEEDIEADEDGHLSVSAEKSELELESSSDEQSTPGGESEITQSHNDQERDESTETMDADNQPKINDNGNGNSVSQSEATAAQDGDHVVAIESPEDKAREVDQSVDIAALEEPPVPINEELSPKEADAETSRAIEEEKAEEEDEEIDDMDDEVEIEGSKKEPNTTLTMSPLKDLIRRMARRIDENTASEEADGSMDNSSKLKEFERILGELIARSKDEQARSQQDEISSSEPDAQSELPAEESKSTEAQPEEVGKAQKPSPKPSKGKAAAKDEEDPNLLGMVLTIKNKVNNEYVTRPENLGLEDNWTVEYNVEEIKGKRAQIIYNQCLARRRTILEDPGDRDSEWHVMFRGELKERTRAGRLYRAAELARTQGRPVHIMGRDGAVPWEQVFGDVQLDKNVSPSIVLKEDGLYDGHEDNADEDKDHRSGETEDSSSEKEN